MTQLEYFDQTVLKVLEQIECTMDINIKILDHDTLKGKHKKALGICWQSDNEYMITIDEYFVTECFEYFILNSKISSWGLTGKTLEHVLCHELAHIQEWRHGKRHTELTNRLLNMVSLPERYYQYLSGKIA